MTTFHEIVPASLRKFRRAYPDVELVLEELNSILLLDRMHHQRLDTVFIVPGREPPTNVNVIPLPSESMMVAVSSEHRLAGCYAIELRELEGEPMVLFSRALGSAFYDEIIETCRKAGFEPMIGQVAPQISSIANLVAASIGVSMVLSALAPELPSYVA